MIMLKALVASALVGLAILAVQANAASADSASQYCPNASLPTLLAPMRH